MSNERPILNVMIACPSGDGFFWERQCVAMEHCAAMSRTQPEAERLRLRVRSVRMTCSLLPMAFNHLWCNARNPYQWGDGTIGTADFFAMLHADMWAEPGWMRKLIEICIANDADAVSAVCAIKSEDGLTSSGACVNGPLNPHHRATMKQLAKMPKTWTARDMGYEDTATLINTGCWVWDVRRPLAQQFTGFHFWDQVHRLEDGNGNVRWMPSNEPEDWRFSQWAYENGGKLLNTREVRTEHFGGRPHSNDPADWTTGMERDEPFFSLMEEPQPQWQEKEVAQVA